MGREWFGIDKWRMDKFMMMSRRFLRQVVIKSVITNFYRGVYDFMSREVGKLFGDVG